MKKLLLLFLTVSFLSSNAQTLTFDQPLKKRKVFGSIFAGSTGDIVYLYDAFSSQKYMSLAKVNIASNEVIKATEKKGLQKLITGWGVCVIDSRIVNIDAVKSDGKTKVVANVFDENLAILESKVLLEETMASSYAGKSLPEGMDNVENANTNLKKYACRYGNKISVFDFSTLSVERTVSLPENAKVTMLHVASDGALLAYDETSSPLKLYIFKKGSDKAQLLTLLIPASGIKAWDHRITNDEKGVLIAFQYGNAAPKSKDEDIAKGIIGYRINTENGTVEQTWEIEFNELLKKKRGNKSGIPQLTIINAAVNSHGKFIAIANKSHYRKDNNGLSYKETDGLIIVQSDGSATVQKEYKIYSNDFSQFACIHDDKVVMLYNDMGLMLHKLVWNERLEEDGTFDEKFNTDKSSDLAFSLGNYMQVDKGHYVFCTYSGTTASFMHLKF